MYMNIKFVQVITPRMQTHKRNLRELFTEFVPKSFSTEAVMDIYSTLFDKMVNLRKKDLEKSWECKQVCKSGNQVTLNLRDELKPYAAKKK